MPRAAKSRGSATASPSSANSDRAAAVDRVALARTPSLFACMKGPARPALFTFLPYHTYCSHSPAGASAPLPRRATLSILPKKSVVTECLRGKAASRTSIPPSRCRSAFAPETYHFSSQYRGHRWRNMSAVSELYDNAADGGNERANRCRRLSHNVRVAGVGRRAILRLPLGHLRFSVKGSYSSSSW